MTMVWLNSPAVSLEARQALQGRVPGDEGDDGYDGDTDEPFNP
jgi:hypothetical protein